MIYLKLCMVFFSILFASCSAVHKVKVTNELNKNDTLLNHLSYLSSDQLQGRKFGTIGSTLAQDYIIKQLKELNVQPLNSSYLAPFTINGFFKDTVANNIVAFIKGSEFPDQYILLSAHYDHLGKKGSKVFNGADDNASGTSALLYFGKLLKQKPLRYSVILLFTDAEEANLKGAKAFVTNQADLLSSIKLNVNVDMIAGSKSTKYLRYISRGLPQLLNSADIEAFAEVDEDSILKQGFRQQNRRENKNINWNLASDHGVFFKLNIPFIYYGVGTHNNYHQTSDTFENINHEFFSQATNIIYQQLRFIDQKL